VQQRPHHPPPSPFRALDSSEHDLYLPNEDFARHDTNRQVLEMRRGVRIYPGGKPAPCQSRHPTVLAIHYVLVEVRADINAAVAGCLRGARSTEFIPMKADAAKHLKYS
jgi:hypothetical protein